MSIYMYFLQNYYILKYIKKILDDLSSDSSRGAIRSDRHREPKTDDILRYHSYDDLKSSSRANWGQN